MASTRKIQILVLVMRPIGVPSLLLGLLVGCCFVGVRNINPLNYSWLLSGNDATSHQLSFEFFRSAPLIQWPLTSTPGLISGSGQVLASANGLFGFPAKIIGQVIDQRFQFYGLWICLLFALQGFFAERLIAQFVPHRLYAIAGSVFFLLAPAFIFRIGLSHYELAAHFLILWCLQLIAAEKRDARPWVILLSTVMLVSIYIWVMLMALFVVHLMSNISRIQNRKQAWILSGQLLTPSISSLAAFVFMGYGSYSGRAEGSGVFRANLLTFVNPMFESGRSLSPQLSAISPLGTRNLTSQEVEGFNFLGIGPIALLLVLFLALIFRRQMFRTFNPLVMLCACLLFGYSLSNNIVIARREISVWWPGTLQSILDVFRSAARFSWPLYYILIVAAIVGCYKLLPRRLFVTVFFLSWCLAIVDARHVFTQAHQETFAQSTPHAVFVDPKWKSITKNRTSFELVPTFDLLSDGLNGDFDRFRTLWDEIENFSITNQLETNFGFVPRSVETYVKDRNSQNESELRSGRLDRKKIYVILDKTKWETYRDGLGSRATSLSIDGFNVIVSNP